jgi:hypothetical protein
VVKSEIVAKPIDWDATHRKDPVLAKGSIPVHWDSWPPSFGDGEPPKDPNKPWLLLGIGDFEIYTVGITKILRNVISEPLHKVKPIADLRKFYAAQGLKGKALDNRADEEYKISYKKAGEEFFRLLEEKTRFRSLLTEQGIQKLIRQPKDWEEEEED